MRTNFNFSLLDHTNFDNSIQFVTKSVNFFMKNKLHHLTNYN